MKKIKIENKKRFIIFAILVVALVFVGYKAVQNYKQTPAIERMNIQEASKKGEKKTVQLLIQITDNNNVKGTLERGDVVLSAPEDRKFSSAEQMGFLIIKMNLTESEQQLLQLSLKENSGIFSSREELQNRKEIKRRKFAVDLEKMGIPTDMKRGKVISDKIFEDDVLIEKKQ